MKMAITLLALTLSLNTMANSINHTIAVTVVLPLYSSSTTSGELPDKQAALVINDSQEFFQSGKMSSLLTQKVSEVQAKMPELSLDEAVDVLVEAAEIILAE